MNYRTRKLRNYVGLKRKSYTHKQKKEQATQLHLFLLAGAIASLFGRRGDQGEGIILVREFGCRSKNQPKKYCQTCMKK